jgi:hypothetical protein
VHLRVIGCEVLSRELFFCAAHAKNTIDLHLLTQGLHDNAEEGRRRLAEAIDSVDPERFDATVLAYGLCSNMTAGLRAGRTRLVVPRAHDCVTILVGSHRRYMECFERRPGCYYFNSGWLEWASRKGERVRYPRASGLPARMDYETLAAKYGEENARYVAEMTASWHDLSGYTHAVYVDFPFARGKGFEEKVAEYAREKGLTFETMAGDLRLLQGLLDGGWDPREYLVLEPGETIAGSPGTDDVLRSSLPPLPPSGGRGQG